MKLISLDINEISKLYKSGKSTRDIAELKNTTHTKIINFLRKNNFKRRTKKEAAWKQTKLSTCKVCGKTFGPPHNVTCSKTCYTKLNMKQMKNNLFNFKHGGSQPRYQRISRKLKVQKCEMCNKSDVRLDVHHEDKNQSNNKKSNIKMLCVSCHAKYHYYNGDINIRGAPRK